MGDQYTSNQNCVQNVNNYPPSSPAAANSTGNSSTGPGAASHSTASPAAPSPDAPTTDAANSQTGTMSQRRPDILRVEVNGPIKSIKAIPGGGVQVNMESDPTQPTGNRAVNIYFSNSPGDAPQ